MAQLFELPIRHLMHSKILSARHLVLMPVMIYPERADCHILADEKSSREYIEQVWAEAMELYRSGNHKLMLSKESTEYLSEYQKQFMLEDADAGMIIDFLDNYKGDRVCTKLLWKEALHRDYDPKRMELKQISDIMNNSVPDWEMHDVVALVPDRASS